jgi:hypothetical protein
VVNQKVCGSAPGFTIFQRILPQFREDVRILGFPFLIAIERGFQIGLSANKKEVT